MNTASQSDPQSIEQINDLIVDSMQDIKANKIVKLDMRQLYDSPTDFYIICEGESSTQVRGIAANIHKRLKDEAYLLPMHQEGNQSANWVCIDYFNTIVHVFHKETRSFYELEELWNDAVFTEYESI